MITNIDAASNMLRLKKEISRAIDSKVQKELGAELLGVHKQGFELEIDRRHQCLVSIMDDFKANESKEALERMNIKLSAYFKFVSGEYSVQQLNEAF